MKRIYFLFSISCFLLQNAHPQTIERSITQGYHTLNELIVPYGADKWLIAGRGAFQHLVPISRIPFLSW
jgi:hypothetical protein